MHALLRGLASRLKVRQKYMDVMAPFAKQVMTSRHPPLPWSFVHAEEPTGAGRGNDGGLCFLFCGHCLGTERDKTHGWSGPVLDVLSRDHDLFSRQTAAGRVVKSRPSGVLSHAGTPFVVFSFRSPVFCRRPDGWQCVQGIVRAAIDRSFWPLGLVGMGWLMADG